MLLVVAIITALLGVGAAVSTKVIVEARKRHVKSMLQGMLGANEQFSAIQQKGAVNHAGNYPIDWNSNNGGLLGSAERFVRGIRQVSSAEDMLMAAVKSGSEQDFKRTFADNDNDGTEEIYDRWGTQIEYRSSNNGVGTGPAFRKSRDIASSVTTIANSDLPLSKGPIFVSAGPDKTFGTEDDITSEQD